MRRRYSPLTRAERDAIPVTSLNLATSAAYAACAARGGHRRSAATVVRDVYGEPVELPVCGDCGVPYRRRAHKAWGGMIRSVAEGER